MKQLINQVKPHIALYTDPDTGLAWVENGAAGIAHSAHPNIDATGSVAGMKDRGYWGRKVRTVASRGFIYNIDLLVVSDKYDELARAHCQCGGRHE